MIGRSAYLKVRRQKCWMERLVMDRASEYVTAAFGALERITDELSSFGYRLYLETKARSWTQRRGFTFCGKGSLAMPGVIMGFDIHCGATGERAIVFSILVAWDAAHWSVQSCVDDEDMARDDITDKLWESPEYTAETFDGLLASLDKAVATLMASVNEDRVARILATVVPRP